MMSISSNPSESIAHGGTRDFIVWEFLNEHALWKPYDPLVSRLIESKRKDSAVVKLKEVDAKMCNIIIDFRTMQQLRIDSGNARPVRRATYPYDHITLSQNILWEWMSESGTWSRYDIETSATIELARMKKKKSVDLYKTNFLPYVVNITNMVQVKKDSGYRRRVRRTIMANRYPFDGEYDASKPICDAADCDLVVRCPEEGDSPELTRTTNSHVDDSHSDNPCSSNNCPAESQCSSNTEPSSIVPAEVDSIDGVRSCSEQFAYIQHVFMAPSNVSHLLTRAFAHFTAVFIAPILPLMIRTPPIPIYVPPPVSRRNTRPVEGVKKPCSPKKCRQYSQQMEVVLKKFSRKCKRLPDDDCAICMMPLNEFSSFVVNEDFVGNMHLDSQIYQLKDCHHVFHKTCIEELYKSGNKDGSLQCPTCKHVYGVLCGSQPDGSMNFFVIPFPLPGFPECDTIQIIYNIQPGIQGLEHPSPGKEYTARGFPRKCYLPNNEEGRKILRLLVIAWERRLIFTIGRSATSGEENTVIWNDIHHKTEFGSNTTGHGYPDPCYFTNVLSELYSKNIFEDTPLSVETESSQSVMVETQTRPLSPRSSGSSVVVAATEVNVSTAFADVTSE